jgi:chromosomal replication initiation ATPase DnaA
MTLHITHPAVRKVIEQCENDVRKMTGNPTLSISFVDNMLTLDFDQVINEVIEITKVDIEGVKSSSRRFENVQARQLIAFYVRRYTEMTYREIGERLGGRDHTTIIACIDRLTGLVESGDKKTCDVVKKMNRRFKELMEDQYER